jgi:hypothetical protein
MGRGMEEGGIRQQTKAARWEARQDVLLLGEPKRRSALRMRERMT